MVFTSCYWADNDRDGRVRQHGEDTGGNQNDKRGGRLESHGARDKFEPQGREIRSEADGELVVREVLGVGTEVVVEGHEDRNGGYEVRGGAGVGRSDVEEGRVERELGIEEHEREVGVGESDLDEERAVLEPLGVQVGELERELEESEVEALLLGLDQPDDGEEARQLTISLRWLSLSDIQRGE